MTPYADLDDTEAYELDLQCPKCGKTEPVSVETLEFARDNGLPDEWVCFECMLQRVFQLEHDV